MNNNKKGVIFAIIAATAFSAGGLLVKLITWSPLSIISGRCVFSSMFLIGYALFTKHKLVVNKTTILGAILVVLNMITYVTANILTTAANTIILEYTAPIYIIIFNLIIHKQRPNKLKIFTVVSVMIGIALVMAGSINAGSMLGNAIAAINGVIYALYMMNNSFEGGDSISSTLMGHVLGIFVGMPSLVNETSFEISVIVAVVLMGIFQSGLGYLMMALSTKHTDALTVSLVSFIEPILNPIWVLIFYKETIGLLSVVGILIVLGSIFYYNYRIEKK